MKFFAVFAAVCAVASASQGWTLPQLSSAVSSPITEAAFKPTLEQALNHVMDNIFSGLEGPILIQTAAGVSGNYNLHQLEAALLDHSINPVFVPHLEEAFNKLISAVFAGEDIQTIPLMVPALEITYMTLSELDVALSSPATNPALVPYLEHAGNVLMSALYGGQDVNGIAVAFPTGLGVVGGVAPTPVDVTDVVPVAPIMVPSPVVVPETIAPAPEVSASTPLVQIILNIQRSEDLDVVAPSPVPSPIAVQPVPEITPGPINIVEQPAIVEPVEIVQGPANPIDAILLPIEALLPTPEVAIAPMV
ncbi:calphotin-like [Ostrinia nubilalis]|uniref:calphotin-like n=1 Tax=Ostrinia nubilalis TaxID=29057 RepID=UPI0030824210